MINKSIQITDKWDFDKRILRLVSVKFRKEDLIRDTEKTRQEFSQKGCKEKVIGGSKNLRKTYDGQV